MIATREELKLELAWQNRVILCGDMLSRERAEELLPNLKGKLAQITNDVDGLKAERRVRLKYHTKAAIVTFLLLSVAAWVQTKIQIRQ